MLNAKGAYNSVMSRLNAASLPRLQPRSMPDLCVMLLLVISAAAVRAGAAEPIHGWGLVDWGMTEAQVESLYGDGVEKLPVARNRRTDVVESLHLKNPVVINGVPLA